MSQEKLHETIADYIPDRIANSSVPIIIAYGETLLQFGTGTLFRVADQSFLITAAHVIKAASEYDNALCITDSKDSFIQVHGDWLCSEKGQYGTSSDPFDIAVLPIDSDIVDRLVGHTFLNLHDVSFEEELTDGIFCLCGYPNILSQPSIDDSTKLILKPFQYTTHAYKGPTSALSEYQERLHILLDAGLSMNSDGSPVNLLDRTGHKAQFPRELGGISGCNVWKIGSQNKPVEQWGKNNAKLVGVETAVYSGKR